MGINLSIKDVPEEQVEFLRQQAKRNHRSLQGELRAIVEAAAQPPRRRLTIDQIVENAKRLGLTSADEATQWIREDRDSR